MAFSARYEAAPIAGINVTPLVDVLLVLLIIFMISAPVIAHKTRVDLPATGDHFSVDPPRPLDITIEANGMVFLNDTLVTDAALATQLEIAGAGSGDKPAVHLYAADTAAYEDVARVLTEAKVHGLDKIDFVQR